MAGCLAFASTYSVSTEGLYTRCYREATYLVNLGNLAKFLFCTKMSHLGTEVFLAGRLVFLFTYSVYLVDL